MLSADRLDAAARNITALGLSKYTLANASYTVDQETGDVTARLQYARQSDEGIWRRYVTLDGKTAALRAVSSSVPWSEEPRTTVTAAAAQSRAEAFLKSVCGEDFARTALYNGEAALDKELTGVQRTFVYAQRENGYFFPANALTVGIDSTDGSVSRYTRSFDYDLPFQSPEGIIDLDAAIDAWLRTYDLTLEYLAVPERLDLSAPEYKPLIEQGRSYLYSLTLAYALEREAYLSGIDAMTGEAVAEPAAPEQRIAYDDLEGHWVRDAAEKLAGYGVGWLGGSMEPGKALTQRDLVALLVSTGGWLYDSEGGDEAAAALYQRAYSMGILEKGARSDDALLTRAQAVKLLLDGAGYGGVAGLEGIFRCSFADEADIPAQFYGYAALAQGLGIVEGAGGSFYASRTATRAAAAAMLCRFLAR